jgi:starch-binding outer membrane protein, SusD/RagB family
MHMPIAKSRSRGLVALTLAVASAACTDITTPDYNRPGTSDLETNPNATLVNAATVGMAVSSRLDAVNYVRYLGILGREAYYLDQNESRYVSELVGGNLNSSSFAGGGLWLNRYGTVAQGYVLGRAVLNLPGGQLTDAQRAGVLGFSRTFMGIDLAAIANTRAEAAIDVNQSPLADPAPLVPQAQVYARAKMLLDSGATYLAAGGSSFSFPLPTGFSQYALNTPAGMLKVNRALRARLDVLTGDYTHAVGLLNGAETFIVAATDRASLNRGVYYSYSTGSGDITNGLQNAAAQVADTALRRDAQLKAGGARDDRFTLKTTTFSGRSQLGIFSNLRFTQYNTAPFFGAGGSSSPIPIIRNEELLLLRAEARWFTGDHPGAMADLNNVRTVSGGLDPVADPGTDAGFRDLLLYERRYSLMYEGGWRWIDLRRFNLLDNPAYGVKDYPRTGDHAPRFLPLPFNECIARGGSTSSC